MDWPQASLRAIIGGAPFSPEKEEAMADYDPNREKREMRAMWIFSAGIVLLILAIMGGNMLLHHDRSSDSTEMSSQSRTAPSN